MEAEPSYSVLSKQGSNRREMYLCFLGWWEIFPHLPPRLLSPLLCWPAFCWEEGIVVGVIQEEQGEGGGVGTIKHW